MNCSNVQDLKKQAKFGKWTNVGESSTTNFRSNMFSYVVKLAPESPCSNNNLSYGIVNHDESSYDSFHNYETDVCKDSTDDDFSDSDSSKTEGYAVLDVEYEVASSSDEEDDNSSISSGTDEFAYKTATAAYYQFNALMGRQETSDELTDDFILADTEDDTDGSVDLELGQADYWKCVKCNNKQNNPLYRYCEKCYQVRKSLFPPRPRRHKKTRADNCRKRKMAQPSQECSTSELESDSEFDSPAKKKFNRDECVTPTTTTATSSSKLCMKTGNQFMKNEINENSKHANSAGELSCNNTSSDEGGETTTILPFSNKEGEIVKKIKVSSSASIEIAKVANCYPTTSSLIKLESSLNEDKYLEIKVENKIIQNVYRQEMCLSHRPMPPKYLELKDSGLSSCQESSQEFSSSPVEEGGYLVRSASSVSSQSIESNNSDFPVSQASTQLQHDSLDETDSEGMLTRVEEFTQKCQDKTEKEVQQFKPVNTFDDDDDDKDIYESNLGMCRFCMVNPKNGVFVHSNCSHLCCCYKCALKVWKKRKSCPVCNCKIKNVLKLFAN